MNYYNEFCPAKAEWIRELIAAKAIPNGEVDERSIADVHPADLAGFHQCHFFAGISGWCEALRIARFPADRKCWTGSAPCQPFSAAGKQKGHKDERHLWPEFFRLIRACRPETVFGEQVASADVVGTQLEADFAVAVQSGQYAKANKLAHKLARSGSLHYHRRWLDGIHADLAGEDYALRFTVLGSHSVRAPHIRQRLNWMAYTGQVQRGRRPLIGQSGAGEAGQWNEATVDDQRCGGVGHPANAEHAIGRTEHEVHGEARGRNGLGGSSLACRLADTDGGIAGDGGVQRGGQLGQQPEDGGRDDGVVNPVIAGLEGLAGHGDRWREPGRLDPRTGGPVAEAGSPGFWDDYAIVTCRDLDKTGRQKRRRIPGSAQPGIQSLADGIPAAVDGVRPGSYGFPLSKEKIQGRANLLRGAGDAINPYQSAAFIQACLIAESQGEPR